MFLSDVLKKEECRNEALQELRKLGIKCRPKKPKQQHVKADFRCFKVPLGALPTETVTLKTGHQIQVPKLVHELCSVILAKVSTEGIFRKEGSHIRQGEMKLKLNGGSVLDRNLHVVDIAVLLKTFLRELPEPLIPYGYHELFLRCIISDIDSKIEALLLACLLLPLEHLNTLTYLMQFFREVSENSKKNKMNSYNIAVVIAPSILPLDEKTTSQNVQMRMTKICEIVKAIIDNAYDVGIIPDSIIQGLGSNTGLDYKKKKRRSGSLTRMFNGLKKIVSGKNYEESSSNIVTPDLLLTPINSTVLKKRKIQNHAISSKKRKELINKMPDNVLLNTPFTPRRTPVSMNLSGPNENSFKELNDALKTKKTQWFGRSKSVKNLKQACVEDPLKHRKYLARRWSAISDSHTLKKTTKRNSLLQPCAQSEPDYICVSKQEYEAIKNRVSSLEKRISLELDSVNTQIQTSNSKEDAISDIQTVYEKTLENNQLSPSTDQLAKRLSRELKIRRSSDQKIIRSPSARKIGSMRRKSQEWNSSTKLTRHQSWHIESTDATVRTSLKRGRPNTVLTGLPDNKSEKVKQVSANLSGSSSDTWVSADCFFDQEPIASQENDVSNDRASVARLRQNAGMVLAKAKLFDQIGDSSSSSGSQQSSRRNLRRVKVGAGKIGSVRNSDNRLSYRVRTLKHDDKRTGKNSVSPRKRALSQKTRVQIIKQCMDLSGDRVLSPRALSPRTPLIKKSLGTKSPKRLWRTPVRIEKSTPLIVMETPANYF